jgi:hypothetical protein
MIDIEGAECERERQIDRVLEEIEEGFVANLPILL